MKITTPTPLFMALETLCATGLSLASLMYAGRSAQPLLWYLWGALCACIAVFLGVTHAKELLHPSLTVTQEGLVCGGEFAWLGTVQWSELAGAAVRRVHGKLVIELTARDAVAFCAPRGKRANVPPEADGTLPIRLTRRGLTSMAQARAIGAAFSQYMGQCV